MTTRDPRRRQADAVGRRMTECDSLDSEVPIAPPGDCWPWDGPKSSEGYGIAPRGASTSTAHRVVYELTVGPVPDGFELDHLCHTADLACPGGAMCSHRLCINPEHLEVVTPSENHRRSRQTGRPTCPADHALTGANLFIQIQNGRTQRSCRICRREASRRYEQSRRSL